MVREAAFVYTRDKQEKLFSKQEDALVKRWEGLVRSMLNRIELKAKYGH
jgi:hypothetical protein